MSTEQAISYVPAIVNILTNQARNPRHPSGGDTSQDVVRLPGTEHTKT